jgi:hypothetical protein
MYKGKPRVTSADSGTLGNPAEKGRCDSDRNAFEAEASQ